MTTQMSESAGTTLNRHYSTSSLEQTQNNVRLSPCPNAAANCPETSLFVLYGFLLVYFFSLSLYQALEKVSKLEAENKSVEQVRNSYMQV